ncbi:hypothetical protein CONCODRAFT_163349 [Conidiobolus coronatus NRRL 28638]|uniref:Uncharacterized protein n=1 Tax=Conidiobolus coronatus (strain ATCC 28846 / CBS 209.66 / NRRL 28638) TaxID=796925 RepID=A0A137P5G9_CONC2|nr:hypothetical protein CONCODRAFT_163349 [Conidiobolus coronatus NRRL 28638]|eukprot:KXN70199.1 hypothetical protein CONCODRAFT_163349 [Conidiobolus coronatus NRRL 28638]
MVGENFNKPIRKMKAKANKDKMLRAQKSKTKQTGDIIHGKAFNRSKLKKKWTLTNPAKNPSQRPLPSPRRMKMLWKSTN